MDEHCERCEALGAEVCGSCENELYEQLHRPSQVLVELVPRQPRQRQEPRDER